MKREKYDFYRLTSVISRLTPAVSAFTLKYLDFQKICLDFLFYFLIFLSSLKTDGDLLSFNIDPIVFDSHEDLTRSIF